VDYFLCREDGTRKQAKLTFVIFKHETDDDWEDDPKPGQNLVQVLGDGDEEVEPEKVIYLGMDPARFLSVVREDDREIVFEIYWRYGSVTLEKSRKTDEGLVCRKEDFGEEGLKLTLSPEDGSEPFSMNVVIPLTGFSLRNENDELVSGDVDVDFSDADKYTYAFIGDGSNDRFTITLENNRLNYLCVLRDDGSLAVRDQHNKLAIVDSIPAQGKLSSLMMNAHQAMVKNKNNRWRITLSGNALANESEELSCNPTDLVRFAFGKFSANSSEEELAEKLIHLEQKLAFQWFWLNENDWSHNNLEGLLDMEGIENDQEKMMQQALVYNRFDAFMRQLTAFSYIRQLPIQGDQLQARNNKRKIARCVKHIKAHQAGTEDIWTLPREDREEILHLFGEFHREFTEKLEED